jgi:hypothetical protein
MTGRSNSCAAVAIGPQDGADDELRARLAGAPAGVRVEHGADADEAAVAELLLRLADGLDGVGRAQSHLDGGHAAGDQRLGQRKDLLLPQGANDGNDSGVREKRHAFGLGAHGAMQGQFGAGDKRELDRVRPSPLVIISSCNTGWRFPPGAAPRVTTDTAF